MRNSLFIASLIAAAGFCGDASSIERRAPDYPENNYTVNEPVEREAQRAGQALDKAKAESQKTMASLSRDMQPGGGRSLSTARKFRKMALSYGNQGDMEKACFFAHAAYEEVVGVPGMADSDTERTYAQTVEELCSASNS